MILISTDVLREIRRDIAENLAKRDLPGSQKAMKSCPIKRKARLAISLRRPNGRQIARQLDCCASATARPRRGTNIAVLRPRLRLQTPYRARLRVESRDNACAIGQHRCAMSRLADAFVVPSVRTGSPILRWLKDMASNG